MDPEPARPRVTPTDEPVEPAAPAEYPLARRVLDVFVAPGAVFEHLRHHAPWVGPLLVAVAVGIVGLFLIPQSLFEAQARETIRRAGEGAAGMPDPAKLAGFARLAAAASVAVATPIMAFASAGVMALLFSVLGGGEARYRQYLAVTTHTMLITALGGLVTVAVQVLRGDLEARLSLALLAPFLDPASFAFRLLHGLDVFSLWAIVVAGLGISVINRRVSWAAAAGVLLGLYVALLAVFASIVPGPGA